MNINEIDTTTSAALTESLLIATGGSVRRITLSNFIHAINADNLQLMQNVAWGVTLPADNDSSIKLSRLGNNDMMRAYINKIGRYIVTNDGMATKLSYYDSTILANGDKLDETTGNVMVIAPQIYFLIRRNERTCRNELWLSEYPISSNLLPTLCVGAYKASTDKTYLYSRSGASPIISQPLTTLWNRAQKLGNKWGLIDYNALRHLQMLFLTCYASRSAQTAIGYGCCGSTKTNCWQYGVSAHTTGRTATLGDQTGKVNFSLDSGGADTCHVSLFGVEDLWGWQWEGIQGIFFASTNNDGAGTNGYIYQGNRMPTDAELLSQPAGNYSTVKRTAGENFVTKIQAQTQADKLFNPIATAFGGNSSEYWTDFQTHNLTGQSCYIGGYANDGPHCGIFTMRTDYEFHFKYSNFGTRLAYYGPLTLIDGAQI